MTSERLQALAPIDLPEIVSVIVGAIGMALILESLVKWINERKDPP